MLQAPAPALTILAGELTTDRVPALANLPIRAAIPELLHCLSKHAAVLLHAPPGAGKSTGVPLALLSLAQTHSRKILMLEPRRLAARAIAARMAQTLGECVGETIGLRTRLETRVGPRTRIEVMTEGVLTRMIQEDAALDGVGILIFDEFHERSLNSDLGLALALESQRVVRPDLKLLIMSATLELESLSKLLQNAPVVSSQGRAYDVEMRHVAPRTDWPLERLMAKVIRDALAAHDGDVLAFLPGAAEIHRVQRALEQAIDGAAIVLPLYGELPPAAQDAALAPALAGSRKIVLATSIAETSLTIDGVRIVVDAGLRRFSQFDPVSGMSRLQTGKISQAAAEQRRGRAGRTSTGVCYRLWSESAHAALQAHTPPEILHSDLAPLAMELALWGTRDADALSWLDAPPHAPLAQARELLRTLEAIDDTHGITPHGRTLARMGLHPRLAHMLQHARSIDAADLACALAALLGERDFLHSIPGERDSDVRTRIEVMRGAAAPGLAVNQGALLQARRNADNLRRRFGTRGGGGARLERCGELLALAYPDRIARRRGEGGRFQLSNGKGAACIKGDALAREEFIVAAELEDGTPDALIRLAAPISLEALERIHEARIDERDVVAWSTQERAVKATRERRLGALVLEARPLDDVDESVLATAVLAGLRHEGIGSLPWTSELRQWQARVALMRRLDEASWPDVSDEGLMRHLSDWAPPWIGGMMRASHFARFNLAAALHAQLSHDQLRSLARDAPAHIVVPSGSRIAIDYTGQDAPSLSVRLQEMFGARATPRVGAGRVPVLVKLLSPAGRPVQITRDLENFWQRTYHDVKKDLKGRYPKHDWPDDPLSASASRRVRRARAN